MYPGERHLLGDRRRPRPRRPPLPESALPRLGGSGRRGSTLAPHRTPRPRAARRVRRRRTRRRTGAPVVIRNAPLLDDGTPMPTRYWLVDPGLGLRVSRLEAAGGVRAAEREVDRRRAAGRARAGTRSERDADLPATHAGPRPSGGVGGTRTGVKCLHAHYAISSRRRRRSGRAVGRGSSSLSGAAGVMRVAADRHRDQLDAPARRRRRLGSGRARVVRRTTHADHAPRPGCATRPRTLHPDAIERTVAVLREYRARIDATGVERVRMTATSASRDAREPRGLLRCGRSRDRCRAPELITGEEEGALDVRRRDCRARSSRRRTSCSTSAAARPSSSSAPTSPKA